MPELLYLELQVIFVLDRQGHVAIWLKLLLCMVSSSIRSICLSQKSLKCLAFLGGTLEIALDLNAKKQ